MISHERLLNKIKRVEALLDDLNYAEARVQLIYLIEQLERVNGQETEAQVHQAGQA
jgi:hypothetical protein